MKTIAEIKDFKLFTQAVDQYAKDREALKQIKSFLLDKKVELELKIDGPFYDGHEIVIALEHGRSQVIRRMNYCDGLLSKTKETTGGWLMWVRERIEGVVRYEGWVATTKEPKQWLLERLGEEDDPDNLELSHPFPLTPEQFSQLNKEIPRV